MGSIIEFNDTLQLTKEQGFPHILDLDTHLQTPYKAENIADQIFEFENKSGIRVFHTFPVRNFLVENREGKWIYWGLVQIVEIVYDYEKKITSGKFKILYINTPEEMKLAYSLIDRRPEKQFFA